MLMKKAPHYIAAFSESKDNYLLNLGFMLQLDLFLSANDVGSCWQATPKHAKEVLESSNLEFVILMAFGKPKEALNRTSVSDFKRKRLSEITNIKDADELLEAARLAPSSGNSQTWYFTGDKNMIHVYFGKPSFIRGLIAKKYLPIDMGIAICHLQIAAEHFGKKAIITADKKADAKPPGGFKYVASLKIE